MTGVQTCALPICFPVTIGILFFAQEVIQESDLQVPHPHIQNRKFILIPLHDIAADLIHPILKKSIRELVDESMDTSAVSLIPNH